LLAVFVDLAAAAEVHVEFGLADLNHARVQAATHDFCGLAAPKTILGCPQLQAAIARMIEAEHLAHLDRVGHAAREERVLVEIGPVDAVLGRGHADVLLVAELGAAGVEEKLVAGINDRETAQCLVVPRAFFSPP
jgi:hypothetical protein